MKGYSVSRLCELGGISRQAYYAGRKSRKDKQIDEDFVVALVRDERKWHPRMGTRKLLNNLRPLLERNNIRIGRDTLYEILRERRMLVKPKRLWVKTTNSWHNLPLYRNLLKDRTPTAPNQVWVSDITHIRTDGGWLYLSLVTDLHSRKILGWNLGETLAPSQSVKALRMAIRQLPAKRWPIHHSDRGSQYCCREYVEVLREADMSVSMTEENHCYENCYAERVNGILKNEYNLDLGFRNKEQALTATAEAIEMYNNWRPHKSLRMSTPCEIHREAA